MRIQSILLTSFLVLSLALSEAFVTPRPVTSVSSHRLQLNAVGKEFENDGLFFFMQPFLSVIGFREGRSTFYGPTIEVKASDYPSDEEQAARREEAKATMTNINQDERDRRRYGGGIAYKIAIAYALVSSLFLDDGSLSGSLARFGIVLPLFFGVGYTMSADKGL